MKHPLENPSLTPHGFAVGGYAQRARHKWLSPKSVVETNFRFLNGDWVAANQWSKANRLQSSFRPAEHIVHIIMPGMRTIGRVTDGDFMFAGLSYYSYDIAVLSALATWLGTNCGSSTLVHGDSHFVIRTKTNEYRDRWRADEELHGGRSLLSAVLTNPVKYQESVHVHQKPPQPTEREELLKEAFLFWLGQSTGRKYLSGLKAEFFRLHSLEQERRRIVRFQARQTA